MLLFFCCLLLLFCCRRLSGRDYLGVHYLWTAACKGACGALVLQAQPVVAPQGQSVKRTCGCSSSAERQPAVTFMLPDSLMVTQSLEPQVGPWGMCMAHCGIGFGSISSHMGSCARWFACCGPLVCPGPISGLQQWRGPLSSSHSNCNSKHHIPTGSLLCWFQTKPNG